MGRRPREYFPPPTWEDLPRDRRLIMNKSKMIIPEKLGKTTRYYIKSNEGDWDTCSIWADIPRGEAKWYISPYTTCVSITRVLFVIYTTSIRYRLIYHLQFGGISGLQWYNMWYRTIAFDSWTLSIANHLIHLCTQRIVRGIKLSADVDGTTVRKSVLKTCSIKFVRDIKLSSGHQWLSCSKSSAMSWRSSIWKSWSWA